MTEQFDIEHLEAGDTFEGGPMEQSDFISAVLGAGGEVKIRGNKVEITKLEKKSGKAKASASPKKAESKEEPKKEAPKAEEPKKEAPKAEEPKEAVKDTSNDKTKE